MEKEVDKLEGTSKLVSIRQEKESTAISKLEEHQRTEALRVIKLIRNRSYNTGDKKYETAPQVHSSSSGKDLLNVREDSWITFDEKSVE